MFNSDKIIAHNLASPWLLFYLYLFPKLIPKVYWMIWGKDLYFYKLLKKKNFYHEIYEFFRKKVFKQIKHVVTYVKGDAELAKKWYGVNAEYHECLMYPSNLYKEIDMPESIHLGTNILLGNSADPSNNHIEVFNKLTNYKDSDIKVYTPLSYGNKKYAQNIINQGKKLLGDKFVPITDFMPKEEYLTLLAKIDIAVFNHNRQQAMGNIITLLGLGKTVYLKQDISSAILLKNHGIKTFDLQMFKLEVADSKIIKTNIDKVKDYFSADNLSRQTKIVFK
jgi:hypothetical protein